MSIGKPIRVLQVVPSMGHGGIEHFLMNLYRAIDREEIQFDFMYRVAYDCVFDEEIRSLGGRIFRCVDPDRHPVRSQGFYRRFFAEHPEVRAVHEHRSGCDGFLGVMHEACRAEVPVRAFHSHSSQKGWTRNPVKDVTDAFNAPRLDRIANAFIACSDVAADYLYGRCPAARNACVVVPNAIDLCSFAYDERVGARVREAWGIPVGSLVIGHVGRFVPEKNQAFLVEVLASLHGRGVDAELVLLGDGPTRQGIAAKAEGLSVADHVYFAGLQADTAPFYSAMDVFCMPSLFEGLPVACVEAQAAGLPMVLSTDVTRQADICGRTFFLGLDQGVDPWVSAIEAAVGDRCGASGALRAAGYDIADVARRFERLYTTGELR